MEILKFIIGLILGIILIWIITKQFKLTVTLESKSKDTVNERTQRRLKSKFRAFFEGWDEVDEPIIAMKVYTMEITNIEFKKVKNMVEMTITLARPGILIGKAGSTIDALTKYMSTESTPVVIKIVESKLWM